MALRRGPTDPPDRAPTSAQFRGPFRPRVEHPSVAVGWRQLLVVTASTGSAGASPSAYEPWMFDSQAAGSAASASVE